MGLISSVQGCISNSNIKISSCNKVLSCTIWNVFLATVFSGSVLNQLSDILDLKAIPEKLAVSVPAQASFFITYVVTQGWTSVLSELFRIIPLICSLISKPFTSPEDEIDVPSIPYHRDVPRVLFFGLLGPWYYIFLPSSTDFTIPLGLFLSCIHIYRNQFINVYAPKYVTAGKFWPIVHNWMIFSLVLMQIIAVGSFALKKLTPASTWMLPLPVLTLLLTSTAENDSCLYLLHTPRSLVKKDREDQKDTGMAEFYDKLVIAYKDPALLPIQYSSNSDILISPLVS